MATPPAPKRKRLMPDATVSARASARVLKKYGNVDASERTLRREVHLTCMEGARCFTTLTVQDIQFGCADLALLLGYLYEKCPRMQARVKEWPPTLDWILCHDECTGGNVLRIQSQKKMMCVYAACLDGTQLREHCWFTLAVVPHQHLMRLAGGLSAALVEMLSFLSKQCLDTGFFLGGRWQKLRFKGILGDYEGLASTYTAKSASALKPCFRCQNVLMKNAVAAATDDYFQTVGSADFHRCERLRDADLFAVYDDMLQNPCATVAARKERDKFLGFAVEPHSLLAHLDMRSRYPPSMALFDTCHNYFSNGVVSSELLLFRNYMEEQSNVTLATLQETVAQSQWQSRDSKPDIRSRLFQAPFWEGTQCKHDATVTWLALRLLLYYAEQLLQDVPSLSLQLRSLQALHRCCQVLDDLRSGCSADGCAESSERFLAAMAELEAAQLQHQAAFNLAYPGASRPKHHFRLHHPEQLRRLGRYVDMFACESRHRQYKSRLSDDHAHLFHARKKTGDLSCSLLRAMLALQVETLSGSDDARLLPPLYNPKTIELELGLKDTDGSDKCCLGGHDIQKGDLLTHDSNYFLLRFCVRRGGAVQLLVQYLPVVSVSGCAVTCGRGELRALKGPALAHRTRGAMSWQWASGWAGRSWQGARDSWAARGSWDADWQGGWADQSWDADWQGGWAEQSWNADWQGGWAAESWEEEEEEEWEEDEEEEEEEHRPTVDRAFREELRAQAAQKGLSRRAMERAFGIN
ncbi:unnamed protein product, partial [Symbiodinium microadriaticum]